MALAVSEIFYSIQGESTFAGLPCVFVRLAGCNLRCRWCDTRHAWDGGREMTAKQIMDSVDAFGCPLVEVTGGEPLFQSQTPDLVRALCDAGLAVLVETNGSLDISVLDPRAVKIVDVKCPSSGQQEKNDIKNLYRLADHDEIKFVIQDREDYAFARLTLEGWGTEAMRHAVHFSPVHGLMAPETLAQWMLDDCLRARLSLQVHKILWGDERGR